MTESRGLRSFFVELGIGARLAVRGGRQGWTRLLLTAGGLALCVMVLLSGLAVTNALKSRQSRIDSLNAQFWDQVGDYHGYHPLFEIHTSTIAFNGSTLSENFTAPLRGTPAAPPGLKRWPAPGETYVSPALAALLATPSGASLRSTVGANVIGEIGDDGLSSPADLRFYAGITPSLAAPTDDTPTSSDIALGWGTRDFTVMSTVEIFEPLITAGFAILIVPLVLFVVIISRLGDAARKRRYAAIRLAGADSGQVRRLMGGETLVAALGGVALGFSAFLVARQFGPQLTVSGGGFFPSDLSAGGLTAVVLIGTPVVAVVSTALGARHAGRNPLGEVLARPHRRLRFLWRPIPLLLGAILLWNSRGDLGLLAVGVVLVLTAIPVLLPWILEFTVNLIRHHPTIAGQLAVRQLQIEPSTPARVVSGVAVVIAGAIAMQTLLVAGVGVQSPLAQNVYRAGSYVVGLDAPTPSEAATLAERIRHIGTFTSISGGTTVELTRDDGQQVTAMIADCDQIKAISAGADCTPGDAFAVEGATVIPRGGTRWSDKPAAGTPATLTLPAKIGYLTINASALTSPYVPDMVLTPESLGAAETAIMAAGRVDVLATPIDDDAATLQQLRLALGGFGYRSSVSSFTEVPPSSARAQLAAIVRTGLLSAGFLTLLVAVAGVVLVSIEQASRRRRPLTALVAAGVPRSVVTRSVLVGMAVPAALGAVMSAAIGIGLSAFLQTRVAGLIVYARSGTDGSPTVVVSWSALVWSAASFFVLLAITALTLPAVRRMTRPESLRTE